MRAADDINIYTQTSDKAIVCVGDGAVELYHDNNKKIETTNTGAKVTGILNILDATSDAGATNAINIGSGGDLKLYHDGSNSFIADTGTGSLITRTSQYLLYNAAGTELMIAGNENGNVELYHNGTRTFATEDNGAYLYGPEGGIAQLMFYADQGDDNADKWRMAAATDESAFRLYNFNDGGWETSIKALGSGAVELYHDNAKVFYTANYGAIVKRPSGGNTVLEVIGSEGNNAQISLFADDGDDNGDKWRFLATDGSSQLYIQNYASGSWETNIQLDGNGKVELYHNDASRLMTTSDGVAMSSQGTDNSRLYFYTAGHTTTRIGYVGLNRFGMDVNGGLEIRDAGNSYETMFKTVSNGACELYHNGTKKFETYQYGIKTTQNIMIGTHAYWEDNGEAIFGDGSDLKIYHSSSNNNSYIEESGSGYLILKSNRIELVNAAGNEAMINAVQNGAVDLYYDNDKKAGTVSTGFHIHNGNISMNDNHKVMIGTSNDLQIWHNGTESWIKNNTGTMNLLNDGTFQIKNNADNSTIAQFTSGSDCKLYYNNTWRLKTDNGGAEVNGTLTCGGIDASGEFNMTGNGAKYLDFFTLANSNSVTFRHHNPSGNGFETFATFVANGAGTISHNGSTRIATDAAGETITGRTVWSGGTSIATQSCYLAAGSDNETQIGMYNGYDERQGFCFYNNGSPSNTSWGMITDQHDFYFKTAAYNIGNSSDLSSNWTTRIMIDGSGHIHSRSSSTQYLVLGSSGDSLGNISNNMNWVRANGDNQQYNTAGGFHAWEVSGAQKMLLEEQNLFLRGADGCRIVLGSSGHGTYDAVSNDTNWMRSNGDNLEYNCCDNGQHRWEVGGSFKGNITRYGEWRLNASSSGDAAVSSDPVHGIGNAALDSQTGNLARLVMQERVSHWISFKTGGGTHYGSIYKSGSNVVYGGTSDYRLKENVTPLTGAITTLKLLKPITYTWNDLSKFENTDTHRGFLAHEVQEVEPDAVSGIKDGMSITGDCVDASGNTTQFNVLESQKKEGETWTKTNEVIDIQQLDERKLIPILTAALQEAITKIETLETKVATLESNA